MIIPILRYLVLFSLSLPVLSHAAGKSPEDFVPPAPTDSKTPTPNGAPAKSGAETAPKSAAPKSSGLPAAKSGAAPFDTAKIHEAYLNGDFDQATRALEVQVKSKQPMSHSDSVFVYKHLGVMYAAAPATREKGKYFMYQLINIEPTAKILDMYASDMIHLIFRNVQEEYESKQGRLTTASPASGATAGSTGTPPATTSGNAANSNGSGARMGKRNSPVLYWVAGGTLVAAGIVGIVIFTSDAKPKKTTITVTE